MKSFRTELENPIVEKDIIDLEKKIREYRNHEIDEEKFRSLRLARGVYGQRQPGVQMVRIKIPYGKLTARQLRRIADIADEYASGTLHATTRQDIQIHYVSLDRTPELWSKLEEDKITIREACGNTVRNITASPLAGIDPNEPFDVSPYARAAFEYFLRNPVCQEMGRKFKISFSSSDQDSAMSFIHDLGFIPKIKSKNDKEYRGFKVLIGGGLGAQPFLAQVAMEFLEEERLIPFIESILRVFDRHGERARRHKARLKYLLSDIGLEKLLDLAKEEELALKNKNHPIDWNTNPISPPSKKSWSPLEPANIEKYRNWIKTNVFEQKQKGYFGAFVKVTLGNLSSETARKLAEITATYAADDLRITVNQGYLLKFLSREALPHLYQALDDIGLGEPGFDSTLDITACPGTDTCNLGISSSTGVAAELEKVLEKEYPDLIMNTDLKIKISGCPNSCGQHGIASIGFHGSSLKKDGNVMPALQVMLGGGILVDGQGQLAERVIKIPSKKGIEALRILLNDYENNRNPDEKYLNYYNRQGKMYFYRLLKPVTDPERIAASDFIDWGRNDKFQVETAVGECAGVIIDLVSTLFLEAREKLEWALENRDNQKYADAIYHAYNTFIHSAKGLLLTRDITCSSQISILNSFDETFEDHTEFGLDKQLKEKVLEINKNEPDRNFAYAYIDAAGIFLEKVENYRNRIDSRAKISENETI